MKIDIGLKHFFVRTILFIGIGMLVSIIIGSYFQFTTIFERYLSIPEVFYIEAPNIRTIILNAFLFGLIAFVIVTYKNNKLFMLKQFPFEKNQILFLLLALFFLLFQYVYKYLINQHTDFFLQAPVVWGIIKILINILFIIHLALGVYGISFIKYFYKKFKNEIYIFFAISIGFYFLMLLVQNLWTFFSGWVTQILYWLFSMFFDNVSYRPYVTSFTMAEGGGPLLGVEGFVALVGKPCSGIDSFLLFTALYILIFILDYHKLKKKSTILFFFIGIIGMFFTNVLRVFLLYMVGAFVDKDFAVGLFHTNVGWILFIIYFLIFWLIISKFIYKRSEKLKSNTK